MPSFYCCSLNCWFFFSTGIEKGILLFFLLFQCLSCYQLCSPNFIGPAVGYCSLFCFVVLPEWGDILEIWKFLLSVASAYDGREMKMEMEEARDFFSSVPALLLWLADRSLWVDDTWWEANTIHASATWEYQWLKNWPYTGSFTCFSLRNREHFPVSFSHDFRASIE